MTQNSPQTIAIEKLADHPQNPRIALREDVVSAILSHWNGSQLSAVTVKFDEDPHSEMRIALRDGRFTGEYINKGKIDWLNDWQPISILDKAFDVWAVPHDAKLTVSRGAMFFRAADLGLSAYQSELEDEDPLEIEIDLFQYSGEDHVYFVQAESLGRIKIGTSSNVAVRFGTLRTSSPDKLNLLGVIPGDCTVERALHKRFADERLHGEWFTPSERLVSYIQGALQ